MEKQPVTNPPLVHSETKLDNQALVPSALPLDQQSAKFCENCHAKVEGAYCSECGQSVESSLKYFWTVVLHLLDDIFSFDSRANRTILPLFFRPGFLTDEYIAGRRVHYVPPLRLYLFISIVFFLSLKFFTNTAADEFGKEQAGYTEYTKFMTSLKSELSENPEDKKASLIAIQQQLQTLEQDLQAEKSSARYRIAKRALDIQLNRYKDKEALTTSEQEELAELSAKLAKARQGLAVEFDDPTFSIGTTSGDGINISFLSPETNKMLNAKGRDIEAKIEKYMAENPTKLIEFAIDKLPPLMFLLLPIFAFLLKVMYLFSKRLYMEHLTVALHSHSFIFFALLIVELADVAYDKLDVTHPTIAEGISYIGMFTLVWIPIYLFMMQKRVYKQGYIFTFIKYSIIGLIYSFMIIATGLAAFIWGVVEA